MHITRGRSRAQTCHQPISGVTHTGRQTHSHLQAICVSPFHLTCMSLECGRKPTQTEGEHETRWLQGDKANRCATPPWWHLTWAAAVKSKCISQAGPCISTHPLSTAPFWCQTAVWPYLSPACNPFFVVKEHIALSSFLTQGAGYLHFKASVPFHKISCNPVEGSTKIKRTMQAAVYHFFSIQNKCLTHLNFLFICAKIQKFMDFHQVMNTTSVSSWGLA